MALGPAILLDLALNSRVQEVAGKLFNSVYSRIFKDGSNTPDHASAIIDVRSLSPEQQLLADRLSSIEKQFARLPTDSEMAAAFAALQAGIRRDQKKSLIITIFAFCFCNLITIGLLYLWTHN